MKLLGGIYSGAEASEASSRYVKISVRTQLLTPDVAVPWNDTVTIFDVPALRSFISETPGANAFCADTAAQAGCILGGGTAVNGMIFIRPAQRDFDDFPEGWRWDDVSDAAERLYERNPVTLYPSADGEYYDGTLFDIASASFESNGWTNIDAIEHPDEKHMMFSRAPCGVSRVSLHSGFLWPF